MRGAARTLSAEASCTLVGAGPGDPELLTLKAVKAIAKATVLLVDDLVNEAVLEHANPNARIVYVGKRGGCQSTPQAFIHKLMVQSVRGGERVVRLKGGDPMIFGRGGEEIEHLRTEGIEVEVINGITSGLAAMTSLGAALTHRDHAHGVVLVTGHAKPDGQDMDWVALAQSAARARLTLVIYMGVSHLGDIQKGLLAGLPGSTPAAIVQYATLPQQREVLTTLADLASVASQQGLLSPSVVVVGDVVQSARSFDLRQAVTGVSHGESNLMAFSTSPLGTHECQRRFQRC
jgi:uroporphyrin-III C-methyltransferase